MEGHPWLALLNASLQAGRVDTDRRRIRCGVVLMASLPSQPPTVGDVAGVIRVRYGLRGNEEAGPVGRTMCITAAGVFSSLAPLGSS